MTIRVPRGNASLSGRTANAFLGTSEKPPAGSASRPMTYGIVIAVALGNVMAMLDVTVVNVALDNIQADFGTNLNALVWIVDSYTLTFAALLLLGGSLADRFGAKDAYIVGLLCFIAASAMCGLSPNVIALIIARLLQGCGAALFMPSSLSLLSQSFPDRRTRAKMVGIWGAIVGTSVGAGPVVGGFLVHACGWRSIFFLNLPIGAIGVLLTAMLLNRSPLREVPFDLLSHALIVASLSGFSVLLIEGPVLSWFASPLVSTSTAIGCAAALLFVLRERLAAHCVIPRPLARSRAFWALNGMGFLVNFMLFGEIFIISLFLEKAKGESALATGLKMLPIMAVISIMNIVSGRMAARWSGRAIIMLGSAASAAGATIALMLGGDTSLWLLMPAIAVCNGGFGLAIPAVISAVLHEAGPAYSNLGAAALNANRQIGDYRG